MRKLFFVSLCLIILCCSCAAPIPIESVTLPDPLPLSLSKGESAVPAEPEEESTVPAADRVTYLTPPAPELTEEEAFARLAPTVNMSFEELIGDNGIYDEITAYPARDTYRLVVDLTHQVVIAYKKDLEGKYTVPVRYMICSSGKNGNRTGTFIMDTHRVRFGKFVNDGVYGQYWSNIYGRIYFHTTLYSERNARTYTSSYKHLGTKASHGCIRLTVPDARWIFYNVAPGSVCDIRKGNKDDLATAAIKEKLVIAGYPDKRPALKKGEIPQTDNWSIEELQKELGVYQEADEPATEPQP